MGFVAYNTFQHCCYVSDALASPLQALHRSFAFPTQLCQGPTSDFSVAQLSKWRVTSINEWQSGCSKLTPSRKAPLASESSQEDRFGSPGRLSSPSACHCSATHLCGPYLSVELARPCGCRHSLQLRVNAYSERFVFLDGVAVSFPIRDAFGSEDPSSEDDISFDRFSTSTTDRSETNSLASPLASPFSSQPSVPETPSGSGCTSPDTDFFIKYFQFPVTAKSFSLVDLALLLNAIQQEHADHRWTDSYADRSLIEFTSAEVFAFLDYFLELDWRNQVLEYRRAIAKRFYDKRVHVWNEWISASNGKLIDSDGLSLSSAQSPPRAADPDDQDSEKSVQELDHERRLLSCMKDRVSFVNDELRLIWMSLAAQKCALQASKMYLDEDSS